MVRIACLNDAFSGILQLEASPAEGQSMQQKDSKRRKGKEKKNLKNEKPKDIGPFFVQISVHAQAKML